jgi:hypothetical protein
LRAHHELVRPVRPCPRARQDCAFLAAEKAARITGTNPAMKGALHRYA